MRREAWQATVPGSQRVGHDRVTNTQQYSELRKCSTPPPPR